jgi:hypothetical protein
MAHWYYAKGRERSAPVSIEQLKDLIARNEVSAHDLVWTAGMEKWMPSSSVPALQSAAQVRAPVAVAAPMATPVQASIATPTAAAAPVATAIPYYTASAGMPYRASEKLKKHARPTGDVGDWPLDDERVRVFEAAFKLRKRISAAGNLYRALLLLAIIGAVILGIAAIGIFGTGRGASATAGAIGMGVVFLIVAAFGVLYHFASKATLRSQRWAPLTMFILFMISIAANLLSMVFTALSPRADPATLLTSVLGMVLPAIFAVISWRAFTAIPRYLAHPAWCQELLVTANL